MILPVGVKVALTGLVVLLLVVILANLLDAKANERIKVFCGLGVVSGLVTVFVGLLMWVWS